MTVSTSQYCFTSTCTCTQGDLRHQLCKYILCNGGDEQQETWLPYLLVQHKRDGQWTYFMQQRYIYMN